MHISSSPFYLLPYHALSGYLNKLVENKKDHNLYNINYHQEAIDVLLDRMERAQGNFERTAFELLIHAPVIIGENGHRGFIQSIISDSVTNSFLVRVWIPDLSIEADLSYTTSFLFDLERMPRLSVHAKSKNTAST